MTVSVPRWFKHWKTDGLGVGACLLIAGAVWYVGVRPLAEAHEAAEAQREELAGERQKANHAGAELGGMKQQAFRLEATLAKTPLKLEPAERTNPRIARLTDLAGACGLQIDDVAAGEAMRGQRYDTVPIRLAGAARYGAAAAFLHKFREEFKDMGVAGFDLSAQPSDPSAPAMFRFDLRWFTLPAKPGAER